MDNTTTTFDLAKLVRFEETPEGLRWVVGPGDRRSGQRGRQVAVIALRHAPGYEVVLQLDNGKVDTFAPMQLFPELPARETTAPEPSGDLSLSRSGQQPNPDRVPELKRPTRAQRERLRAIGRGKMTRRGDSWVYGTYQCPSSAGGITYVMMCNLHEAGWVRERLIDPQFKRYAIELTPAGREVIGLPPECADPGACASAPTVPLAAPSDTASIDS